MDEQQQVAAFLETHDLHAPPAYRLLDLVAEVGELAADAAASSDYGAEPAELTLTEAEVGDALFALLAVTDQQEIDAGVALQTALDKYDRRIEQTDDPGSGH